MTNQTVISGQEPPSIDAVPQAHQALYHAVSKQRWSVFQKRVLNFWQQHNSLVDRQTYAQRYYVPLLKAIVSQLPEDSNVLEIGSGPICTAQHMNFGETTYVDPLLDDFRRLFPGVMPEGATYVTQMAEKVELKPKIFDAVVCLNTLSDVLNPELVLNNVEKGLKPTGYFLVSTDIWPAWLARAHLFLSRLAPSLPRLNRLYSYTHKGFENTLSRHFHILSEHRIQTPLTWLTLRQECFFVCEHLEAHKD